MDVTPDETLDPEALIEEPAAPEVSAAERSAEEAAARRLAERYRLDFLNMHDFRIDQELFRSIPADLMLRYGFVPYRRDGKSLVIVVSDPTDLPMIDELGVILGTPVRVMVGARSAIEGMLKKSESSQRVLDEATEEFQIQVLKDDDLGDENLTVERLTSDSSPIIRLVDSTIYTAIQRRASDIHIETQDDAVYVKYRIDGVLQSAMRPIAKRFHSSILSRIKVMVGEIRDPETAQIAIQSALTGHLVFTTVHANNVFDVLGRFLNMGVEPYQFISALNCVMAQRLVRKICEACRQPVTIAPELLAESAIDAGLAAKHTFYEGAGCIECGGTGFKGRMAICELLDLTDHIREIILEKRPISEVKRAAREQGMRLLRESAVERVLNGETTLREINKVTFVE